MIDAQKDPLKYAKATIDELDYGEASHSAIQAVSTYALAYAVIALVERLDQVIEASKRVQRERVTKKPRAKLAKHCCRISKT